MSFFFLFTPLYLLSQCLWMTNIQQYQLKSDYFIWCEPMNFIRIKALGIGWNCICLGDFVYFPLNASQLDTAQYNSAALQWLPGKMGVVRVGANGMGLLFTTDRHVWHPITFILLSLLIVIILHTNLNPPQITQGQESAQCPLVVNQLWYP